jgi:hypothetical protein
MDGAQAPASNQPGLVEGADGDIAVARIQS